MDGNRYRPGAQGGVLLPGGSPDNPLAMGHADGPPLVVLPLTPVRIGTAASLDTMRAATAPVTVVAEADVSRLMAWHHRLKPEFEVATGVPLTYTAFFARATVLALQAFPLLNGTMTSAGIMLPRYVHLGVAVHTPAGVLVPVLRNAERMSVFELAAALHTSAQRARAGVISSAEMAGHTFVMTNPGSFGESLFGTPTIKAPNAGALSFERIQKRPVVTADDQLAIRPMMYLALTADHRSVDGAEMIGFLGAVRRWLEEPTL